MNNCLFYFIISFFIIIVKKSVEMPKKLKIQAPKMNKMD